MLVDTTAEREFTPDFLWLSSALEMLRENARNFSTCMDAILVSATSDDQTSKFII